MDNNELIDELIEKIVMNFEDNYVTKNIIKKLTDIYDQKDILKIDNNTITRKSKRMTRTVTVDTINKVLKAQDTGYLDDNEQFQNSIDYQVNGNNAVVHKHVFDVGLFGNTETRSILDTYEYFKDNNMIGSSDKKIFVKLWKNSDGQVIDEDIDDFIRIHYKLANGDVVKIVSNNGDEKYYYCDRRALNNRNKLSNEQESYGINKEISKEQADDFLKMADDAYKLVNNDMIYSVRGATYK